MKLGIKVQGEYWQQRLGMATEVHSLSETECGGGRRPSSLPPPPADQIPDPPHLFVSDSEAATHQRRNNNRKVRKNNTVSGVTLEARRVLEHLLRRSLSDAPQHSDSSGGGLDPRPPPPPGMPRPPHHRQQQQQRFGSEELTHHSIMERMMKERLLDLSHSERDESDYVYTHELVRRPPSLGSQGSGKIMPAAFTQPAPSLSGSSQGIPTPASSTKHACQSPKFPRAAGHTPGHTPSHSAHKHGRHHHYDDEDEVASSTSTEDYEYTDPNEFLRRKKKSFFRRHTERLMHTFRRRKQRPLDLTELECCQDEKQTSPHHHKCAKKKKKASSGHGEGKLLSPFKSLGYSHKEGRHDVMGAVFEAGMCSTECALGRDCIHHQVLRTANSSPEHVTHYTDIEQWHEESMRRRGAAATLSPLPWQRSKHVHQQSDVAGGHASDGGGRDRGLFDSLLRNLKKRSSFRSSSKHKHAKDSRFHSEENLRRRAITRDQEAILQRYAHARQETRGPEPEILLMQQQRTVETWQEMLDQSMSPQQLAARQHSCEAYVPLHGGPSMFDATSEVVISSGRPRTLLPASPPPPPPPASGVRDTEEPDYDEIADQDDIDGMLTQMCDPCPKPFHERTPTEKELLYERIADQLCAIADHYKSCRSFSRKSSPTETPLVLDLLAESSCSSELEGAAAVSRRPHSTVARQESCRSRSSDEGDSRGMAAMAALAGGGGGEPSEAERELAAALRARGDAATSTGPGVAPLVRDLVYSVEYKDFQARLSAFLGNKQGWHQVAMMFRLTQSAVQISGLGTAVAARIKENTLKYFEDQMAGWIVKQGGWESVVEDTSSELD